MMPAAVMWRGGSAKSCSDGSDGDGANGRSGQVRLGQASCDKDSVKVAIERLG